MNRNCKTGNADRLIAWDRSKLQGFDVMRKFVLFVLKITHLHCVLLSFLGLTNFHLKNLKF
jgi:hypothetical protein